MTNIGEFQCACRFYRAEEFTVANLVEPCGYHAAMGRALLEARQLLTEGLFRSADRREDVRDTIEKIDRLVHKQAA